MTRSSSTSATASRRARPALAAALLAVVALPGIATGGPLPDLLNRIGRQEEKFWTYFPSVTCTETVTQAKLGVKDKPLFVQHRAFDYLITLQSSGLDIQVDESRMQKGNSRAKGRASLLETDGFSLFSLIFHPLYQSHYEFTQLPDESAPNGPLLCIAFRQVTTDHPLSVLRVHDHEYPLAWRGKAWINPVTASVVRVQAGLGDSMEYLGLLHLDVDVTYALVKFSDSTSFDLPSRAVIDAETRRQHWHNVHQFADYRRFAVDTEQTVGAPKK